MKKSATLFLKYFSVVTNCVQLSIIVMFPNCFQFHYSLFLLRSSNISYFAFISSGFTLNSQLFGPCSVMSYKSCTKVQTKLAVCRPVLWDIKENQPEVSIYSIHTYIHMFCHCLHSHSVLNVQHTSRCVMLWRTQQGHRDHMTCPSFQSSTGLEASCEMSSESDFIEKGVVSKKKKNRNMRLSVHVYTSTDVYQ